MKILSTEDGEFSAVKNRGRGGGGNSQSGLIAGPCPIHMNHAALLTAENEHVTRHW